MKQNTHTLVHAREPLDTAPGLSIRRSERTSRLTVLHLVAPARFGGLERVVHALAGGHAEQGHDVHAAVIVDADAHDHPFVSPLMDAGVRAHPLCLGAREYLRERESIARLCREIRPDVVHSHGYRPDVLDAGVARKMGIGTVSTVHGFTGGGWKNRAYEWLQRRSFRRFDAVVAVSRPQVGQLRDAGVPGDRLHLVPNAWRPAPARHDRDAARRLLGVPADGFRLGWVGRLGHEKGADVLLDALAHLSDLPVSVSIVGDGRERALLEERARVLGVSDRIHWHGMVENAPELFPAFDLFVLSSRTEGTPIALFEAIGAGVPVAATRVGGVPDVVSPAEALLVPPLDPEALAAAIRTVWSEPASAGARAAAARDRLRAEHAFEPWLDRYAALYENVLERKHHG